MHGLTSVISGTIHCRNSPFPLERLRPSMGCALDLFRADRADVHKGADKAWPKSTHRKGAAAKSSSALMCTKAQIRQRRRAHIRVLQKESCACSNSKKSKKQIIQVRAWPNSGSVAFAFQKRRETCNPPRCDVPEVHKRRNDANLRIKLPSTCARTSAKMESLESACLILHPNTLQIIYEEIYTLAGRACTRKGRGHTLQSSVSAAHYFDHFGLGRSDGAVPLLHLVPSGT